MEVLTEHSPRSQAQTRKSTQPAVMMVFSTHWDREWYEPFQHFRYRLVSMLDEVLEVMQRDERFSHFQTDGQSILIEDYLQIRPEKEAAVRELAAQGRLAMGPWYVQPDEFIPSGESLVRNLQEGMRVARQFGQVSKVGFLCDIFGHTGQMPQIMRGMGIESAIVWRGTNEKRVGSAFSWESPDGTAVLAYRFGPSWGYGDFTYRARSPFDLKAPFDQQGLVDKINRYIEVQKARGAQGLPVLIFDGSDHLEIEPGLLELLTDEGRKATSLPVQMGTLDDFASELHKQADLVSVTVRGELREPGQPIHKDMINEPWRDGDDAVWVIPGVLSSRIHLKQANARCESVLTQWAEPFACFAQWSGQEYPHGFLSVAWRELLANHAHDSICCCSIDQVHRDMVYRFDQAEQVGQRLKRAALEHLARGAAAVLPAGEHEGQPDQAIVLFNPTSRPIDEPVDFTVELDPKWPSFNEFFGYEPKHSFWLVDAQGEKVPYQRHEQNNGRVGFIHQRRKFPSGRTFDAVQVTARVQIPAFGYTVLGVQAAQGATRWGGAGLVTGPRRMENQWLAVQVESNGLLSVTDKQSGQVYGGLLELEDCADIGDGWYHGMALNDRTYYSGAQAANVAVEADGPQQATLRIELEWTLPRRFNFSDMRREEEQGTLRVCHRVTLRADGRRVEVKTVVDNRVEDHRLRVLFPTGAQTDTYLADSQFDAVRRPIALDPEHIHWREIEVETKPQQSWTAVYGEGRGLAVVSAGLPESAVQDLPERPIALTLLRSFKKAVFTNGQPEGQIQGLHEFHYWIVPLDGQPREAELSWVGQRLAAGVGLAQTQVPAGACECSGNGKTFSHPQAQSCAGFLSVQGEVVITAVKRDEQGRMVVRLFNPAECAVECTLSPSRPVKKAWLASLDEQPSEGLTVKERMIELNVEPHRILCVMLDC